MGLRFTQPLTEIKTKNRKKYVFLGIKVLPTRPHRHLIASYLENLVSSKSHKLTGLYGLLQGQLYNCYPRSVNLPI
jgi:hypothetical protein